MKSHGPIALCLSSALRLWYPWHMIEEKTILVVEDEPDIQELIVYHLAKEGFKTLCAASGKEALQIIRQQKPDLVLLDLMLPEVSGMEVLKTVRYVWNMPDLPI